MEVPRPQGWALGRRPGQFITVRPDARGRLDVSHPVAKGSALLMG